MENYKKIILTVLILILILFATFLSLVVTGYLNLFSNSKSSNIPSELNNGTQSSLNLREEEKGPVEKEIATLNPATIVPLLEALERDSASTTVSENGKVLFKILTIENFPQQYSILDKDNFNKAILDSYNQLYQLYKNDKNVNSKTLFFLKSRSIYSLNSIYNLSCSNADLFYQSDWAKDPVFLSSISAKNKDIYHFRQFNVQKYIYTLMSDSSKNYSDRDSFTYLTNRARTILWNFPTYLTPAEKVEMETYVKLGADDDYVNGMQIKSDRYPQVKARLTHIMSLANNKYYLYLNGQNPNFDLENESRIKLNAVNEVLPEKNALSMIYRNTVNIEIALDKMYTYEKAVSLKYPNKEELRIDLINSIAAVTKENLDYINTSKDQDLKNVYGTYLSAINTEMGSWDKMRTDYLRLVKYYPDFGKFLTFYGVDISKAK